MVQPSSPSAAVAVAISVHRGKRTGIVFGEKGAIPVKDGMEDMNKFWDAAKTPDEKPFVETTKKALKPQNASVRTEIPTQKPRFSLLGQVQDEDDDDDKAANKARQILSRVNKTEKERELEWSPSELSRVSTAPPTPASVVTQHDEDETLYSPPEAQHEEDEIPLSPPEEVRASPSEEHDEEVLPHASNSPTVGTLPTATNEPEDDHLPFNDDDDMLPPPPPEEEGADLSLPAEDATQDDVEFPDDDDDDDGDKEGVGFTVVHDPETPESVRSERVHQEKERERKKKDKRKKDVASVGTTTVQSKKLKRSKKEVTYSSPMGYPAGNRDYEFVPVSDFKESPKDDNVRRSRRARTKPLAFWKNERAFYEAHNETGVLGEAMGNMPVVTAFIAAQPTPYKKRKVTAIASKSNKKKKSGKHAGGVVEVEDTPFDSKKLRKVRIPSLTLFVRIAILTNTNAAATNSPEI
jgi:centromere protein C